MDHLYEAQYFCSYINTFSHSAKIDVTLQKCLSHISILFTSDIPNLTSLPAGSSYSSITAYCADLSL